MRGMDEGRRSRLPVAPLVAVVVLLLLPALYVFSIGPIGALISNGYIKMDSTIGHAIQMTYAPLAFCAIHWPPFESFLVWYMRLWGYDP